MINKIFNTTFGIIVLVIILLNIIYAPPRFVKADGNPIEIETEDKETKIAFLTWEQDSWNLLETFYLFPSKRQLCLYNEDLDLKWELEEYPNITIPEVLPIPFTIPIWKYWLATISLILGFIPIYLVYVLKSYYNYIVAKKQNTFSSYKNYLLRLMLPNFMRNIAGQKLKSKIGAYKEFLKLVTYKTSGELKEVLFKITDSIAETGNVKVNLSVENKINIIPQKEFLKKNSDALHKIINEPISINEFNKSKQSFLKNAILNGNKKEVDILNSKLNTVDDFKNLLKIQRDYLIKIENYSYEDLTDSFSDKKNIDRKYLYSEYLDELFKVIFPEKLIKIENHNTSLMTFHLKSTIENKNTFQYWRKDEDKYLSDIILLPEIKCSWKFYVTIKYSDSTKKEYISKSVSSTKSYKINNKKESVEDYYMFIVISSFAKFTKEIVEAFGMAKNLSIDQAKNNSTPLNLYLLFENKMSDYLMEQTEGLPNSMLEEFIGEYESSLNGLLIDDEYLDVIYSGFEGIVSAAKEIYEGIDILKEAIQDS